MDNTITDYTGKALTVSFIGKDQNWQDETTTYWFNVDDETYGVSDHNGDLSIVDSENYPVNTEDAQHIHLRVFHTDYNALQHIHQTDELRAE